LCHSINEAWQAGYDAPCAHGVPDPAECESCRLKPEEIARLVVLLAGMRATAAAESDTAAAA
jgi:hypothetical protein